MNSDFKITCRIGEKGYETNVYVYNMYIIYTSMYNRKATQPLENSEQSF